MSNFLFRKYKTIGIDVEQLLTYFDTAFKTYFGSA